MTEGQTPGLAFGTVQCGLLPAPLGPYPNTNSQEHLSSVSQALWLLSPLSHMTALLWVPLSSTPNRM